MPSVRTTRPVIALGLIVESWSMRLCISRLFGYSVIRLFGYSVLGYSVHEAQPATRIQHYKSCNPQLISYQLLFDPLKLSVDLLVDRSGFGIDTTAAPRDVCIRNDFRWSQALQLGN